MASGRAGGQALPRGIGRPAASQGRPRAAAPHPAGPDWRRRPGPDRRLRRGRSGGRRPRRPAGRRCAGRRVAHRAGRTGAHGPGGGPRRARPAMSPGLVTAGETMGLVVQGAPGSLRNGEPMTFGMGGSESNVAIGVRRLGLPATWIGRVGEDPPGGLILRELRAERVDAVTVTDPAPTGLMVRWRPSGAHGRVGYYRRHSAGSHLAAGDISADVIRDAAVLHVTGITLALGPGPAEAIAHAVQAARDAGVTVSFDLNHRSALW